MHTEPPDSRAPLLQARQLRSERAGPIDFSLHPGETVCIVGRSGAGKSVFLRLLADLDPGEGGLTLEGVDRMAMDAPAWRRQVLYQAAEATWWMPSFREHLHGDDVAQASAHMARLDLAPELLDQPLAQLSTGQRQRLALVRSLAPAPRVLLLDEPTASLDADSTARVEALLKERCAAGCGVVWVTHSAEQAARMGDRVLTLVSGKLSAP
ncbi:ATP-binding cassette domain-containing protein [Xylophilus rhododendri]|uniref:ATP-binding cassette domain-containing protein n=1 Tax=Xylophilus rhododendri TaxID=2697032 RepID=A0A857J8P6_9BURK|nr:ATP-binding cassette domain-containing protein [Xylophilus rhododendri]QHJ00345.1 ATP-binding cassette domain-containing protein [Xylophilus rhododendri]